MAHGGSQAGGRIGATAAGLQHSSWKCWILNPLSKARDQTYILMDTTQVGNPVSHNGNSHCCGFDPWFSGTSCVPWVWQKQQQQQKKKT